MNFGYDSVIGILAAFLTTLSFVPQIIKAYHTKRMKDVSRYLMILFTTGSILWIVYGVLHEDLVIIGANATAATFNLILLYYSFVYSVSTWELVFVLELCDTVSIMQFEDDVKHLKAELSDRRRS
jgi:MtN3 and saliva related transmembrane protein